MTVVVVGAGVGGLTAAALLARAGIRVTVLEAHVYAGGCAGTFYNRGYRFDAGATLAGGFAPGGPMDALARALDLSWPVVPFAADEPAMAVHLPARCGSGASSRGGGDDGAGQVVSRWVDAERWRAERGAAFGAAAERFWEWQERTADALWEVAMQLPAWPPQTPADVGALAALGARRPGLARRAADALRTVRSHLPAAPESLRRFVDAQLLIASQATSARTNALYGAAALDLPRRGLVHPRGGMGALAATLAAAVERGGGRVLLRQRVTRVRTERGRPVAVETARGLTLDAGAVIFNLPPAAVAALVDDPAALGLPGGIAGPPADGWGAFTVYAGVDEAVLPRGGAGPLHIQVARRDALAEGHSVFISISPAWDAGRAPPGRRAVTLSTHTRLAPWWEAARDSAAYRQRRALYAERLLTEASHALPGFRDAAAPVLPGTPRTFERFTRRPLGWVGGYPQTGLLRARGPRAGARMWLVGDSIFPGQSTAAVALGGMRVASLVRRALE